MTRSTLVVLLVCVFAIMSPAAFAQAPRPGRVIVTVVDPTGAVLPGATVSIIGLDEATKKAVVAPIKASEKGIATFEKLPPAATRSRASSPASPSACSETSGSGVGTTSTCWSFPSTRSRRKSRSAAIRRRPRPIGGRRSGRR